MGHLVRWISFFVGTPQHFLVTAISATVIWGFFNPRAVGSAIRAFGVEIINAVSPLVEPVLTLFFVIIGLGILWKAVFGKKGGGSK